MYSYSQPHTVAGPPCLAEYEVAAAITEAKNLKKKNIMMMIPKVKVVMRL
jgi:hypothetical protein